MTVEHLVLKAGGFLGSKYITKYHADLGSDLQKALEVLEQEGWEVVTSHMSPGGASVEIILKRRPR